MLKVENSDVIKHVLSSLVDVTSSKTSEEHALLMVKTLLKNLELEYDFLRYIKIDDVEGIDNNLDAIVVVSDINYVESIRIGKAIQEIIDVLKKHLGKKAGYYFIREFREDLGEDYHSVIKNMDVDLRLVEMQDKLFGWDSEKYTIRKDEDENISYVEHKEDDELKRKIMVVDDNTDILYVVKEKLERLKDGYKVTGASSGKKCLELLKGGEIPDLILLDIMMPDMNGWDVLAKLRNKSAWKNIPVLFLTAKTDDTSKGLGTLTSDGYITKPFDATDLYDIIEKVFMQRCENVESKKF